MILWLAFVALVAVKTRHFCDCEDDTITSSKCAESERRVCCQPPTRQLEMRTKLLVGSALLLWLFGFARPRYFCSRPFGWGHI